MADEKKTDAAAEPKADTSVGGGRGRASAAGISRLTKHVRALADAVDAGAIDARAEVDVAKGAERELLEAVNAFADALRAKLSKPLEQAQPASDADDGAEAAMLELANLVDTTKAGRLDIRARTTEAGGLYGELLAGVNEMLDAVVAPIRLCTDYLDRVSRGDIPDAIVGDHPGEYRKLRDALNLLRATLGKFVAAMNAMYEAQREGDIDARMPAEEFSGVFRTMAQGVNDQVALHVRNSMKIIDVVGEYGSGNLSATLERFPGKQAIANERTDAIQANIQALTDEVQTLSQAAVIGALDIRGNAELFKGAFRDAIAGINATLDAVIGPINVAAQCVDRISRGDIPEPITEHYEGDFNRLRDNLNTCIEAIRALIEDVEMLVSAAVHGRLRERADARRHAGEFRRIVEGINKTLDAVLGPMQESADVLAKVADHDLTARVSGRYEGEQAAMKDNLNRAIADLQRSFAGIGGHAEELATSSKELAQVSHEMGESADRTASQASVVRSASEEVSKNVHFVAVASEEMLASIREIAKSASEAAKVAKNAVAVAHTTNETIERLGTSSQEIGAVVKVITSIAQQTNLLALNATIEAARAGDAGKGFAVVAHEVKELAKQTAKATEEISRKVENIQGSTKGAVKAIADITGIINQINDISNLIASAVEEQMATTNEMGKNITRAADGASDIASSIAGVADAAKQTSRGAGNVQQASGALGRVAGGLEQLVRAYRL